MSGNGGFPPIKIKQEEVKVNIDKKRNKSFEKIVKIDNIIKFVKNPMIDMNKEEIKIIDDF